MTVTDLPLVFKTRNKKFVQNSILYTFTAAKYYMHCMLYTVLSIHIVIQKIQFYTLNQMVTCWWGQCITPEMSLAQLLTYLSGPGARAEQASSSYRHFFQSYR